MSVAETLGAAEELKLKLPALTVAVAVTFAAFPAPAASKAPAAATTRRECLRRNTGDP